MASTKRKKLTIAERYIRNLEELDEKDQQAVIDYALGLSVLNAQDNHKQIEFDTMAMKIKEINDRFKNWGKAEGLKTGNWVIDAMTMGLAPGEVTVIGGATSNGKSALAINIAAQLAMKRIQVLFVTLEMTHIELGMRFKKIMGDKFEEFASHILWQNSDEMNWRSIDGLIHNAKVDAGAEVVIIDHLHYFTRELQNTAEELGIITKEFKKNAIRHEIPIILLSHTRKAPDSNSNKTGINDLRGSSYIAQDADIVLMVRKSADDKIEVTLGKNRNRYGMAIGSKVEMDFKETVITPPVRY